MSDYTLFIGSGSPAEVQVLKENFELNLQANWQSNLACDIDLENTDPRIAARSEIVLKRDGVAIFGGVISQTPEEGYGGPNLDQIVQHIAADGFDVYFTYRLVTLTIPAGTTLKAAMLLLETYLPTGVIVHPSQVTGPSLTVDLVFTKTRLDECVGALGAETEYVGGIDPDKHWRMVDPTANPAPFDLLDTGPTGSTDDTLYQVGDVKVERTLDDDYANRIIGEVRGAGPATSSETFVAADGVTAAGLVTFTAKYPASQSINDTYPNLLYIDGVVQSVIGWGAAQLGPADWYWNYATSPATLVYPIAGGRPFPVGAEVVSIAYAIGFPFYVEGNNLADQALYPVKEALVSIDEAMTIEAAQAYVDREATARSATIERALYTTEETTLAPGMVQTINLAKRAINASCLITELRFYSTPERPGSEFLCDVVAVAGTTERGNVRQTYKDWLKQGGAGAAKTGIAVAAVAPPLRAVQFNDLGGFGGVTGFEFHKDEWSLACGEGSSIDASEHESCQAFGYDTHISDY